MKNNFFEGVRFGNSEISKIKNKLNDFSMGIEFEFHPEEVDTSDDRIAEIIHSEMVDNWGQDWDKDSLMHFIVEDGDVLDHRERSLSKSIVAVIDSDFFDEDSSGNTLLVYVNDNSFEVDTCYTDSRSSIRSLSDLYDTDYIESFARFLQVMSVPLNYLTKKDLDVDLFDSEDDLKKKVVDVFANNASDILDSDDYDILEYWVDKHLQDADGNPSIILQNLGVSDIKDLNNILSFVINGSGDIIDSLITLSKSPLFVEYCYDSSKGIEEAVDIIEKILVDIDDDDLNTFIFDSPLANHYLVEPSFEEYFNSTEGEHIRNNYDLYEVPVNLDVVRYDLPDIVFSNLDKIHDEHDRQVEVVSNTVNIELGLQLIDEMLEAIRDNWYTSNRSGMHISISTNNDKDKVDLLKYIVLTDIDYIVGGKDPDSAMFPPRDHVLHLGKIVRDEVRKFIYHNILSEWIFEEDDALKRTIEGTTKHIMHSAIINKTKYQSIKFADYNIRHGRIELRYFGGEGYENKYDEIERLVYRALYILDLSKSDTYKQEYKKSLYKLIFEVADSELNYSQLVSLYRQGKKRINIGKISSINDIERFTLKYKDKFDDEVFGALQAALRHAFTTK